jgi:hypothetical protein
MRVDVTSAGGFFIPRNFPRRQRLCFARPNSVLHPLGDRRKWFSAAKGSSPPVLTERASDVGTFVCPANDVERRPWSPIYGIFRFSERYVYLHRYTRWHFDCVTATMAYAQRPDLITSSVDDETLLLSLRTGQIHQLNPTATRIWNECDGVSTAPEIAARVASVFDACPEPLTVLEDVLAALAEFEQLGLLLTKPYMPFMAVTTHERE